MAKERARTTSRRRRRMVRKPFCEEPLEGEHLWIHADNDDQHPEIKAPTIPEELDPGVTAFFPVHFAKRWAPKGAHFVVAVASSAMFIECRSGYFIAPSSISIWKWVLYYLDWDEPGGLWVWHIGVSTDRSFRNPAQAAAYLLFQLWKHDKTKWDEGMFQEIEGCGRLLSETDIAEKAFGQSWKRTEDQTLRDGGRQTRKRDPVALHRGWRRP